MKFQLKGILHPTFFPFQNSISTHTPIKRTTLTTIPSTSAANPFVIIYHETDIDKHREEKRGRRRI